MKTAIKLALATLTLLVATGIQQGTAYCSSCKAVDCMFDTQCGARCSCIKLSGKVRGQCVEKW